MNKENEPFEQQLKRRTLKRPPEEWRQAILAAAKNATDVQTLPMGNRSFFQVLNSRFVSLLWPHPVAWAGLTAIWIFIFSVNFSIRDKVPVIAEKALPPAPEVVAQLRRQERLYAELMGENDSSAADRPKVFVPKPRSEVIRMMAA